MQLWLLMVGAIASSGAGATTEIASTKADSHARAANCEAQFRSLMEDNKVDATAERKLTHWMSLATACGGTSLYQLRLGGLNVEAGRLSDAKAAFLSGLKMGGSEKEIEFGICDVEFRLGHLKTSLELANRLTAKYPEWSSGYSATAQVQLVERDFDAAIENLEHANSLEPSSGAYQLLAMAYYQQKRPRESARSMQQALKLNRGALRNTQAVCATANSLVQLGHVPEADELLKKHLELKPEDATNRTFLEAERVVREHSQDVSR